MIQTKKNKGFAMFLSNFSKLDISIGQIISICAVVIACFLAFWNIRITHNYLKDIISQNEQIQINLSKTKNNSDLQKILAEYHINNTNYSKQLYEQQTDWLNVWLIFVGILLTSMAIVMPLRYTATINRIQKKGDDVIKEIRYKNMHISKTLTDSANQINIDLTKFKLEYGVSLELQWLWRTHNENDLENSSDIILLMIDTECDDNSLAIEIKNELYSKVFQQKAQWYKNNNHIPDHHEKSLKAIDNAIFFSPNDLNLYISKSYILGTGNMTDRYEKVIELLENVLSTKCFDATMSALNTLYYNLAEAYILSTTNNNLPRAANLIKNINKTKIRKDTLAKDFVVWKNRLQTLPESVEKQKIMDFINEHS